MTNLRFRAWLCLAPLLLYGCDATVTLLSQPADYWQGDYAAVEEGNPVAKAFLVRNPLLFIGVATGWGMCFTAILILWHHPLAVVMSLILTVGHAVGAASWLPRHGTLGYVAAVGLLIAAERLLSWSWVRAGVSQRRSITPT